MYIIALESLLVITPLEFKGATNCNRRLFLDKFTLWHH